MVQRTNARNQIYDDYRDNNHMTRDQVIQQTRAYQLKQSGKTNVCCINIKDGSMAVAIYASIYGFLQLFIFGWQTGVLSECSAVTMSQANLQCEWNCPCVGASTARTARLIEGLFIVQVICLISSFFMLFASLALVYGVHKASRYFIWPWFPVMLSSILTTMAYCVLWWTGDVRDYWLAITIVETIAQFINCYCFVVIISFYNRLAKSGGYKKEYTPGKAIHFDDNVREINEDHIELPQRNYHETPIEDQNLKYYNDTKFIEPSFYDDHHFVKENCGNCGNLLVYTEDGATCLSVSYFQIC
uniref:MARVEL domain-containing protein n=1 Tax=Rhabditophanes sp. KR3021 TaxID=114890 RepID=A0AC35TRQ1_9BILA